MAGLPLLGLGVRAGTVVIGTAAVRDGLQKGQVVLVVVPGDRSERTEDKVVRLAVGRGIPVIEASSARALGAHVGCGTVQAVGVRDRQLARGIRTSGAVLTPRSANEGELGRTKEERSGEDPNS